MKQIRKTNFLHKLKIEINCGAMYLGEELTIRGRKYNVYVYLYTRCVKTIPSLFDIYNLNFVGL